MYARDALNQLNAYARSHGSGRDLNQGEIDEASKAIGWQPGMDVDASAMPAFQREIDNRLRAAGAYQEPTTPGFSGPPAPNPHHPDHSPNPNHPDHPIEMAGPQIRDPAAPAQEQPGRMIPEPAMPPQLEMPGRMSHDPAYQPPPPAPAPNPASPESAPAMTEQRQAAPPPQPATPASPQPASMRALRAAPTSGGVGWNTPATPGPAQLGQQQQTAQRASMSALASRGRLY